VCNRGSSVIGGSSLLGGLAADHAAAGGDFKNGVADVIDQIAGGHRHLAVVSVGELAGGTVEVYRQLARGFRVEELRKPCAEHAGQDIPGSARGHARTTGRVDEDFFIGRDDQRPVALQNQVELVALGEVGRNPDPIGLEIFGARARRQRR
jgi:hypothetical protein